MGLDAAVACTGVVTDGSTLDLRHRNFWLSSRSTDNWWKANVNMAISGSSFVGRTWCNSHGRAGQSGKEISEEHFDGFLETLKDPRRLSDRSTQCGIVAGMGLLSIGREN
jgi:hypothetical protein